MAARPVDTRRRREPEEVLPLKPTHYLLLVSLADGDRHGYALKKDIRRRTGGKVDLGQGTLYRSIRQLEEAGLIEETADRPDAALDDDRRRYYRLTEYGRGVARAETDRLAQLVRAAKSTSLLAGE